MKKIISLKTFSIVALLAISTMLGSCRQDDESDFQKTETSSISKVNNSYQSKASVSMDLNESDPPVKNGTHWKTQN